MKTETNDPLDNTLRKWQVKSALPPRFQEQVWQRIARAQSQAASGWRQTISERIEAIFKRPKMAVSYMAILLFLGLSTGYWHAHDKSVNAESQWRARYVQSVDPYQMPRN